MHTNIRYISYVCMYVHKNMPVRVFVYVCVCVACSCRLSSLQFVNLEVDAAVAAIRIWPHCAPILVFVVVCVNTFVYCVSIQNLAILPQTYEQTYAETCTVYACNEYVCMSYICTLHSYIQHSYIYNRATVSRAPFCMPVSHAYR